MAVQIPSDQSAPENKLEVAILSTSTQKYEDFKRKARNPQRRIENR
jgi:hypothetical protein